MSAESDGNTANQEASQSSVFAAGYVTLEALENTKVAVAQFAATALANGADQTALKELAMLQSTLYTLQHQQVYQIKLIEELQSQLAKRSTDDPANKPPANEQISCDKVKQGESEKSYCDATDRKCSDSVNDVRTNSNVIQKSEVGPPTVSTPCLQTFSQEIKVLPLSP